MALSVSPLSQKGSRKKRRSRNHLISEINVTPFVDVILVLLIIFMVSAPLVVNGVPLDLPKSQAGPIQVDRPPLTVSLDEKGRLAINNDYYNSVEELIAKLKSLLETDPTQNTQRIFVRAARTVEYQEILALLASIQKTGFSQVSLASLAQ
ncbi:ExbD/TolR family protein [Bartonella bacilliformis]|uniref:Protein TolR n=1 Tax=Bartonella bacilliformis Ver097 TaxID=1293911 RepID=A0A072R6T7_BARBA|nr:ExbD/TolR family protein [Bartonella bacilliformis]KEG21401.1 protein TolR [Bartonella bacilliformis Ver097]